MTNRCPYCKDFRFTYLTYEQVHDHVIECSKEYVDTRLLKYYIQADTIKRMGNRPVLLEDRRSNDSTRRAGIGDRRVNDKTFYHTGGEKFGAMTRSGYYMAEHFIQKDRRKAKGLGRRNGPQRRKLWPQMRSFT